MGNTRHNRGPFAPTATRQIAATLLEDILGISKFGNNPPPKPPRRHQTEAPYPMSKSSLTLSLLAATFLSLSYTADAMESTNVWSEKDRWFAAYKQCLKREGSIVCKRYVPKLPCIAKTNNGIFAYRVVRFYPSIVMDERWSRGGYCGESFGCYPPYEIEFISPCNTKRLPRE